MPPDDAALLDDEPVVFAAPTWLVDAAELLGRPDPGPTPWLVDGLIVDRALIAAVGRWKTTKSYALLDVCISIATGRPAFGRLEIPTPGPVVFVNEESGLVALWRRLDALCRGRAINPEELRGRLHVSANARMRLDDAAWQNELLELGAALKPRLFVFDPLARMKDSARDENAQADMAVLIEFVRHLRDETDAAVAFVHHTGHAGGNMRGSSDLESAWETRLTWDRDGQSPLVTIDSTHREAEPSDPIRYRIAWDGQTRTMRFELDAEQGLPPLADRIRDYVDANPKSKGRDIAKGVQVRATDVERVLEQLVTEGTLAKGRSGRTDKLGRELRDEVYTLSGGSSQTLFDDPPGTNHGTNHNGASHGRTHQDETSRETRTNTEPVARPATGTDQDEPQVGHRGPVVRPPLYKGTPRDEPPQSHPVTPLDPASTDGVGVLAAGVSSSGLDGMPRAREGDL